MDCAREGAQQTTFLSQLDRRLGVGNRLYGGFNLVSMLLYNCFLLNVGGACDWLLTNSIC